MSPDRFTMRRIETVRIEPNLLVCVPDLFKTQEICNEAVRNEPHMLRHVLDHLKTQEMCDKTVYDFPWVLGDVSDHLKTSKVCNEAVGRHLCLLEHIFDWFITRQQLKIWHDDNYWHNNALIFELYHVYQKSKVQKAKIKEEHLPTA